MFSLQLKVSSTKFYQIQRILPIQEKFSMSVPKYHLLKNVHFHLPKLADGETYLTTENYDYHHYKCDGFNDVVSSVTITFFQKSKTQETLFF